MSSRRHSSSSSTGSRKQQQAADPGSSRIAAPADRSTAPVVGLLQEAAQLGCLPVPETALIASALVGSTRGFSTTSMAKCGCVGLSHFSRALYKNASNNAGKTPESTTSWETCEEPRTNQPTNVSIRTISTRDVSTLTREIYHRSSRPDPHETCTSWVTRSVSDRVS